MKKLLLLSVLSISTLVNAQLGTNKRLVVPEFGTSAGNNKVKTYFPTSPTTIAADPAYTINFSTLGNGLATNASPNAVTMRNKDLYVTLAFANQRIYKFPGYGNNPASAIANVTEITRDGNDYVGIAFDVAGNLYCSEGSYLNTNIVKYTAASNYASASKINLGNGGITSYFANITFDTQGNLWSTDYLNNRLILIFAANLSTANASMEQLVNAPAAMNATGASLANIVNAANPLSTTPIDYLFSAPEGLAFDSNGNLWIANNNENGLNARGTIVKITADYIAVIKGLNLTTTFDIGLVNSGALLYNTPNSPNGSCKFGGLQIDNTLDRIYVNEQRGFSGLFFNTNTIFNMVNNYSTYQFDMVTSNPGNGGIFLADAATNFLASDQFDITVANIILAPNPSNGSFTISSQTAIATATATDVLGKEIDLIKNGDNYTVANAQAGMYFLKIVLENGAQTTKKIIVQ